MSYNRDRYQSHVNLGLGESAEKPCRNCVDAASWFKSMNTKNPDRSDSQANGQSSSKNDKSKYEPIRKDCPPFVDELGRSSWTLLHSIAAKFPANPTQEQKKDAQELMRLMSVYYPCEFCADDLKKDLKMMPPQVDSQESFSRWMCRLHNLVNKKLGKKEFDCELVQQRWRDGWADGSCN